MTPKQAPGHRGRPSPPTARPTQAACRRARRSWTSATRRGSWTGTMCWRACWPPATCNGCGCRAGFCLVQSPPQWLGPDRTSPGLRRPRWAGPPVASPPTRRLPQGAGLEDSHVADLVDVLKRAGRASVGLRKAPGSCHPGPSRLTCVLEGPPRPPTPSSVESSFHHTTSHHHHIQPRCTGLLFPVTGKP